MQSRNCPQKSSFSRGLLIILRFSLQILLTTSRTMYGTVLVYWYMIFERDHFTFTENLKFCNSFPARPLTEIRILELISQQLIYVKCRGSVSFWYGSGSADPWIRASDLWVRLRLRILHNFLKIKSHKEVTKQEESRFFLLFLLDDRRIRILIQQARQYLRILIRSTALFYDCDLGKDLVNSHVKVD